MILFINALAASAGGGLTYVRNVIPQLAASSDRSIVLLRPGLRGEFGQLPNIDFVEMDLPAVRRFWYEQFELPDVIRRSGADVLLSTGNFALRNSPVPQILLSRNSIYTSQDYFRDLRKRGEFSAFIDTYFRSILAKKSISWADVTVAPSEAFAVDLRQWAGGHVIAVHHGFDYGAFTADTTPLPEPVQTKLDSVRGALKLLFVSHYNYYRNFETLIRSLPIIRQKIGDREVKLLLTCELAAGNNPGGYRSASAATLVRSLGVADMVVELGTIPYRQLHNVYASADLYITPAYTETFAHPLVEAMSSGLPIVASDIPVHREICHESAIYFPRFSAEDLADSVMKVAASPEKTNRMSMNGLQRAKSFSWKTHVEKILEICQRVVSSRRSKAAFGQSSA